MYIIEYNIWIVIISSIINDVFDVLCVNGFKVWLNSSILSILPLKLIQNNIIWSRCILFSTPEQKMCVLSILVKRTLTMPIEYTT